MLHKRSKPILSILSTLLPIALLTTGCTGQEQKGMDAASPAVSPEPVYTSDEYVPVASWITSGIDLHAAHRLMGDTLYYMTGKWDPGGNGYTEASLCRRGPDNISETLVRIDGQGARLILYVLDESGNLYYLHSRQDGRDKEYFWTKLSPQGETLSEAAVAPRPTTESGKPLNGWEALSQERQTGTAGSPSPI